MSARLRADLALVLVAAVWGATFVMVKDALDHVGPLWFLALRFSLAALAMAPLVARRAVRATALAGWGAAALVGLFLFLGYALQTAGLQHTSASRAGFITGLSVVLVPLGMAAIFRAPPGRPVIAGVVLAMAGLALLSLAESDLAGPALGDALVLGCALAFAAHILAVGRWAARATAAALTFGQILAAAGLSLALAVALEPASPAGFAAALPAALFTALFATVGAFYVQTRAQRFTSATHTALIFSLEPVFAALFAALLGGERLGPREAAGCALILAGMLAAQLERDRR